MSVKKGLQQDVSDGLKKIQDEQFETTYNVLQKIKTIFLNQRCLEIENLLNISTKETHQKIGKLTGKKQNRDA